jgi:hypothetical protein
MAYSLKEKESLFNDIIDNISLKGLSLRQTLALPNMPDKNTFYIWINEDKTRVKSERYARARTERADMIFEEMLEISDTTKYGNTIKESEKHGTEVTKADMVAHRRLQIDTRKWVLSRMLPKKYGDRITSVHEGGDNPVKINAVFNTDLVNVPTD